MLVPIVTLYHCILSLVSLLSNTQVNVADLPSHTVTSSGPLITVIEIYVHVHNIFIWLYNPILTYVITK